MINLSKLAQQGQVQEYKKETTFEGCFREIKPWFFGKGYEITCGSLCGGTSFTHFLNVKDQAANSGVGDCRVFNCSSKVGLAELVEMFLGYAPDH